MIEWLILSKILMAIPCLIAVVAVIEAFLDYVDIYRLRIEVDAKSKLLITIRHRIS